MLTIFKSNHSTLDASGFDLDDYPILERFADNHECDVQIVNRYGTYYVVLDNYDLIHAWPVDTANMRWLADNVESLADGTLRYDRLFQYSMSLFIDVDAVTDENIDELVELASYEYHAEPFSYDALGQVESEALEDCAVQTVERLRAHDYDEEKFTDALQDLEVFFDDDGWPVYAEDDVKDALVAAGA